ncbi:MAG: aspartate-semialdehyde dehydrogenase [Dehalococcoidales bacterium]|nr:aspartate-semialdehyde dehydrogenase [Dehalococcoidales bacterium]
MKQYRLAVVGATGMVGQEFIKILEQRNFPVSDIQLYTSDGSAGKKLYVKHQETIVKEINHESFAGMDIVFFSAGTNVSRHFVATAVRAGALVIDNSDAWRLEGDFPLVVPEVNIEDIIRHKGVIVNPTSPVIQMVVVLSPLHRVNPIKRIIVTSYQSVAGAGLTAIEELTTQVRQVLDGQPAIPRVFPHQIAFNLLPEVDVFMDTGYTKEERKLLEETRRIMHAPEIEVSATCVRVPVFIGNSEAVHIEFTHPFPPEEARRILSHAPGVRVLDDTTVSLYPQPWAIAGTDECYVGRLRKDSAFKNGLAMWIVADNIRKGAALNAIQILEEIIKRDWLVPGG